MKRTQIEIMGLMIIVVIISLLLLFAVRVMLTKGKKDIITETASSGISSSMVNAILQTHSGCTEDTYFKDLFIDCMRGETITCTDPDRTKSCEYANKTVGEILDKTLSVWNYKYNFIVRKRGSYDTPINIVHGNFTGSRGGYTQPYPLSLYPAQGDAEISLCINSMCKLI